MKNLNEHELLDYLQARRETPPSYEELTSPNYLIWGRARELTYHQSVCLLAGLMPITKSYFDILLREDSTLAIINWYIYYPIKNTDWNRLRNIDHLLESFPSVLQTKKNNQTMQPKEILALCKNHPEIAPFLPIQFVEVVDNFGPHPSINLPSIFSSLEVNPTAFENLKKFKERENKPLALNTVTKENSLPEILTISRTPPEPPLSIAKRLLPLRNLERWGRADAFSLNEIILLHYDIDPNDVYFSPMPGELVDAVIKEFLDYLNRYFHGDRQLFISSLDEKKIIDLLRRSIHAGALKFFDNGIISKIEIVEWMETKGLSFPIRTTADLKEKS
jgi:hypothetical protein